MLLLRILRIRGLSDDGRSSLRRRLRAGMEGRSSTLRLRLRLHVRLMRLRLRSSLRMCIRLPLHRHIDRRRASLDERPRRCGIRVAPRRTRLGSKDVPEDVPPFVEEALVCLDLDFGGGNTEGRVFAAG